MRYLIITFMSFIFSFSVKADSISAAGGKIEITPIIHSSVQLEYNGIVVQIDPWSVGDLSNASKADVILVSDDVGHHLDVRAISQLRKPGAAIVIAANGLEQVPDGIVINNGEIINVAGVTVESVAAYDIIQGSPSHPKGEANGYVVTLGGKKLYFAGVTECVPEVKALKGINVVFFPMNVPLARMTPSAVADCVKELKPDVAYVYHYDQGFARKAVNPDATAAELPGGLSVAESLEAFREAMKGDNVEVRLPSWYPDS